MIIPDFEKDDADTFLVQWWVPSRSRRANHRGGRSAQVADIFGKWRPLNDLTVSEGAEFTLPAVVIETRNVLAQNVELDEERIPFAVFDKLRKEDGVDVTGFNLSMTANGNTYRSYVLLGVG